MASPIYYLLLSLQNGLGNCVPPELRAIKFMIKNMPNVRKKRGVALKFFYDCKITEEIKNHVGVATDDVDTCSDELVYMGYELIYLDTNKSIPGEGEFAFLRHERVLPKFERKDHSFLLREKTYPHHSIYQLDMQQALLGRVVPTLRHVSVDVDEDKKKLMAHFIYDGEISELSHQLAIDAIQDSRISFPDFEMEPVIERIDYPMDFVPQYEWLAYWRQEWLFTDSGPIPAIHKHD